MSPITAVFLLLIGLLLIALSIALYDAAKKHLKSNDMGRSNDLDSDRVTMRGGYRPYSIRNVKVEEQNYN